MPSDRETTLFSDLLQGSVEIPCILLCNRKKKEVMKLSGLISQFNFMVLFYYVAIVLTNSYKLFP